MHLAAKWPHIVSVVRANTPSKLDRRSTSMESIVALIGHVHDNTVQGEKNELKKQQVETHTEKVGWPRPPQMLRFRQLCSIVHDVLSHILHMYGKMDGVKGYCFCLVGFLGREIISSLHALCSCF